MKNIYVAFLFIATILLTTCKNNPPLTKTQKSSDTDPFRNEMVKSEFITVDGDNDTVIEATQGTRITIPKGAFIDANGHVIDDSVMIELAEAYSMDDIVLSNLTTSADGQPLETAGMVYFNATKKSGEQLAVNPDKPVYIEMPAGERKPGMMAYEGERDSLGNMNWKNPKKLENYLVTVPLNELDFLPARFKRFAAYFLSNDSTVRLTDSKFDSLYYSFSGVDSSNIYNMMMNIDVNEPWLSMNKKIQNNKYTTDSYTQKSIQEFKRFVKYSDSGFVLNYLHGVDPAIIKTIKSDKFQNTYIATREFEKRLQYIFNSHNDKIMEIYIDNIGNDLWVADSLAAALKPEGCFDNVDAIDSDFTLEQIFKDFAKEKAGNVQNAGLYAGQLKKYYAEELKKNRELIQAERDKYEKLTEAKNASMDTVLNNYRELLWKREKYRMETYGFTWTKTGWINIDAPVVTPSNQPVVSLKITVDNGADFDRVYTYIVYESIKSIYRFNTDNNINFYAGSAENSFALMPYQKPSTIISVGYKGADLFIGQEKYITGTNADLHLTLKHSEKSGLEELLEPYKSYLKENSIAVDLTYMEKIYLENNRRIKERELRTSIWQMYMSIYRCDPMFLVADFLNPAAN